MESLLTLLRDGSHNNVLQTQLQCNPKVNCTLLDLLLLVGSQCFKLHSYFVNLVMILFDYMQSTPWEPAFLSGPCPAHERFSYLRQMGILNYLTTMYCTALSFIHNLPFSGLRLESDLLCYDASRGIGYSLPHLHINENSRWMHCPSLFWWGRTINLFSSSTCWTFIIPDIYPSIRVSTGEMDLEQCSVKWLTKSVWIIPPCQNMQNIHPPTPMPSLLDYLGIEMHGNPAKPFSH